MLGLGNAVTKQQEWSPGYISDLIGWWDFSDLSTMFQERDGTFVTPVSSQSDPIGSIKNKAMPHSGGIATPNSRIGSYLYASSDSERPSLGTHPSIGRPYAIFDGTDDHLMCEHDDDGGGVQGGISGSVLSSANVDLANMTYTVVLQADNASISSSDDIIFVMQSSAAYASAYYDVGTQDFEMISNSKTVTSTSNFGNSLQTFTVISSNDLGSIFRNGTAEGTSSGSDWFSTGDSTGDFENDHNAFTIGENYRGANGSLTGRNFDGKICEIIVYNKALSSRENERLQSYILSKWYTIT
jgi:hypothetical protein